jgi:SAM-dependent methyltransferase
VTTERPAGYVPAAGHDWLLPLYDPLLRLVMREHVFKGRLVREAEIAPGHRVLDLGCGTGTLTLLVKAEHPAAAVCGVDGDPKVLAIAHRKAGRAGADVSFDQALADRLPYPDRSFDRVLSCLVLHHLTREEKLGALREVRRVLRPGGSLHVVDFGRPVNRIGRALAGLFHPSERGRDNIEGGLPALFESAGLEDVAETGSQRTPFGVLSFFRGRGPAPER